MFLTDLPPATPALIARSTTNPREDCLQEARNGDSPGGTTVTDAEREACEALPNREVHEAFAPSEAEFLGWEVEYWVEGSGIRSSLTIADQETCWDVYGLLLQYGAGEPDLRITSCTPRYEN